MSNPILINGFEDIITFIKQQEHRNQQLKEEINKLKEEIKDISMRGIKHTEGLVEKINELKEENESLMKSEVRHVKVLKEEIDDLKGRLEDVNHTAEEWEDSYNELKQESEESYNELKQKSIIQDYIIKNMLYKFLCDGEDAEIEIDKKWGKGRGKSFNKQYSDVMKEVCKKMDEDDWNDNANRGGESAVTLDWENDILEVVFDEEEPEEDE